MKVLTKEESGRNLARVWLHALESTTRDFMGSKPKGFIHRAYEHATESWLRILEKEFGVKAKSANTILEAVESYVEVGVQGQLFEDYNQIELKEVNPFRLEVTVYRCPYFSSCSDLIEAGINISDLTCARLGRFSSAAKLLANIETVYQNESVKTDRCTGVITKE